MWKTLRDQGGKSLENGEKSKSCAHGFPQKSLLFVENFAKSKNVQTAQFFLLMEEKWEKQAMKKQGNRPNTCPNLENRRGGNAFFDARCEPFARGADCLAMIRLLPADP